MPLAVDQILVNRYRIVALLGQGGFGAVYRAWDQNVSRLCAVKENLDASPEAARQFNREAVMLANLDHPNLPRVNDYFFIPNQGQYLVMDFVEGEDLARLVHRQGPVPPPQALVWITQICNALAYLHSQNPPVLHRDIKPANIKITPQGQAMLVDFGLVKIYDQHLQTTVGARAVTPGYSPPEQYGHGSTDPRSDIYALAATLYALLTGEAPPESIQRVVAEALVPVHERNRTIPPAVGAAIHRAMALSPSQRYPTIDSFRQALQAATGGLAIAQSAPPLYSPPPTGGTGTAYVPAPSGPRSALPAEQSRPAPGASRARYVGIGLGCLACVGLTGVLGLGAYLLNPATPVAPAATATATATAQPPTPRPSRTPKPSAIYSDSFEDEDTGWYTGDEAGTLLVEYRDGEYVVEVLKSAWYVWGGPTTDDFSDVHIEVTARNTGEAQDPSFGIICNLQNSDDYDYLAMGADGYYAIKHVENGEETHLASDSDEWEQSDAIEQNADEYRIAVDCAADGSLRLAANGQTIDDVSGGWGSGSVALIVLTFDDAPAEVHFDDFTVTSIE